MSMHTVMIGASALLAIAGVAYACDQKNKRGEEQKRARTKTTKLKKRISKCERKLGHLLSVLENKNHQIRDLAELAEARRRAG